MEMDTSKGQLSYYQAAFHLSEKFGQNLSLGLLTNRIESNFEEIEFHRIEFEQYRIRFGN